MVKDKNPVRGSQRKSLLHEAAAINCLQTYQIVSDQVQNKIPRDKNGNSPLHLAVLFGHIEMVEWIFRHFPESISVLNHLRMTPVDLAKENPYKIRQTLQTDILAILTQFPFQ